MDDQFWRFVEASSTQTAGVSLVPWRRIQPLRSRGRTWRVGRSMSSLRVVNAKQRAKTPIKCVETRAAMWGLGRGLTGASKTIECAFGSGSVVSIVVVQYELMIFWSIIKSVAVRYDCAGTRSNGGTCTRFLVGARQRLRDAAKFS